MIVKKRAKMLVANWKMYLSAKEAETVAEAMAEMFKKEKPAAEVIVCPSFPQLALVGKIFAKTAVQIGVQDIHPEDKGPFTGDVSVKQVAETAKYAIIGHSERRQYHGENDVLVAAKTAHALKSGIHPIVCVGETEEEKDAGQSEAVVTMQAQKVLDTVTSMSIPRMTFAYEPIWAISAGPGKEARQPDPVEVSQIAMLIRKLAARRAGDAYAEKMRVLYGGSINGQTARMFISEPGVDGALVGGASTKPAEFLKVVKETDACL